MTYNFDPDLWYENERDFLVARHARGELDEDALAVAIEELDRRYDEMLERIDRANRAIGSEVHANRRHGG